jgi:phage-related protein
MFYVRAQRIILLHGFIKKPQKTPIEDKALALKRKNEHSKAE